MILDIPTQELIYIAMGFRGLARDARADAAQLESPAQKEPHLDAAETYERLARKYQELSEGKRRP